MAANGISTLPYKRDRQIAKLEASKAKRVAQGKVLNQYDLNLLPTVYAVGDNDTNHVVDNPNIGGLKLGRPWITGE